MEQSLTINTQFTWLPLICQNGYLYSLACISVIIKYHSDCFNFLFQVFLGISVGVGLLVGLLTLCLFYVGLFLLGKCFKDVSRHIARRSGWVLEKWCTTRCRFSTTRGTPWCHFSVLSFSVSQRGIRGRANMIPCACNSASVVFGTIYCSMMQKFLSCNNQPSGP